MNSKLTNKEKEIFLLIAGWNGFTTSIGSKKQYFTNVDKNQYWLSLQDAFDLELYGEL